MSEWIDVTHELPPFDVPLLYVVSPRGYKPYVRYGMRCDDGRDSWWTDIDGETDEQGNDGEESFVTYWMLMPKPKGRKRPAKRAAVAAPLTTPAEKEK